jgi:hypothetical protein
MGLFCLLVGVTKAFGRVSALALIFATMSVSVRRP